MKIFAKDSILNRFTDTFGNLTLLNLMFMLSCLGVITIPAAITALYACTLRMVRHKEFSAKYYWQSLRRDFKQSLVAGLLIAVVAAIFGANLYISKQMPDLTPVFLYALYFLIFLLACIASYIFPMIAQFENKLKDQIKNSALLAMRHVPKTLMILLLNALPVALFLIDVNIFVFSLLLWALFGFAVIAFINSRNFLKIFAPYLSEEEESSEEDETRE